MRWRLAAGAVVVFTAGFVTANLVQGDIAYWALIVWLGVLG